MKETVCVVARARARIEHEVVARMFALTAHFARGKPHGGVEPEEGRRYLREQLGERVEALDVRQLVEQHDGPPIGEPRI